MALPDLNEQIQEYAAEVRAKTRVDDLRRDFNLQFMTSYGLRQHAEWGTDIEGSVDTVAHLLRCVQRSFNTFRIRCRLWYRKVKTVARAARQWKGVKQRRVAALYSAWIDWESTQIATIKQQYPHRPTGEVRRMIEDQLVTPSPGQKHKCIILFYQSQRRLFHTSFGDWHRRRQQLQRAIKALKKQAVVEKAEQAQADLAREELAVVQRRLEKTGVATSPPPSGRRASAGVASGSALEELDRTTEGLSELLCQEPRFDVAPTPDVIRLLVETARRLHAGASEAEMLDFQAHTLLKCGPRRRHSSLHSLTLSSVKRSSVTAAPSSPHAPGESRVADTVSPDSGRRGTAASFRVSPLVTAGDAPVCSTPLPLGSASSPQRSPAQRGSARGLSRIDTGLRRASLRSDAGVSETGSPSRRQSRAGSPAGSPSSRGRHRPSLMDVAVLPGTHVGAGSGGELVQRKSFAKGKKVLGQQVEGGELRAQVGDDDDLHSGARGSLTEHADPTGEKRPPARLGGRATAPELDSLLQQTSPQRRSTNKGITPLNRMLPKIDEDAAAAGPPSPVGSPEVSPVPPRALSRGSQSHSKAKR